MQYGSNTEAMRSPSGLLFFSLNRCHGCNRLVL